MIISVRSVYRKLYTYSFLLPHLKSLHPELRAPERLAYYYPGIPLSLVCMFFSKSYLYCRFCHAYFLDIHHTVWIILPEIRKSSEINIQKIKTLRILRSMFNPNKSNYVNYSNSNHLKNFPEKRHLIITFPNIKNNSQTKGYFNLILYNWTLRYFYW